MKKNKKKDADNNVNTVNDYISNIKDKIAYVQTQIENVRKHQKKENSFCKMYELKIFEGDIKSE